MAKIYRHSIRVLYNGRRWWYQPQTLLTEKSGLISTPAVWLIQRILRAHGYDHTSLVPMWGRSVTSSSWVVGDVVFPSVPVSSLDTTLELVEASTVGRIVPPSALPGSPGLVCDRESGMVCVEFVDDLFGVRVGIVNSEVDERASRVHRVKVDNLLHAGFSQVPDSSEIGEDGDSLKDISDGICPASLARDIVAVSKLDVQVIDSVAKECEKSEGALARAFASGLPNAVLDAVCLAEKNVQNHEDQSNLLPAIAALGNLLTITGRHLYKSGGYKGSRDACEVADDTTPNPDSQTEAHRTSMQPGSRFANSFGIFQGEGDSQVPNPDLRNQVGSLSRSLHEGTGIPPVGQESRTNEWVLSEEVQQEFRGMPSTEELGISAMRSSCPLRLYSPTLQSVRRGGFEPLLPGEDARRGAPVLNAATKSAISNGILSNNYTWFHKVIETAKRRKGSTSTSSSLSNARDEDGMPLLVLAITLGCSPSIVSYLIRNGATVNDDVIKIAAHLGLKEILSQLLTEHVYIDGILDQTTCSQEVMDAIESATQKQKDQAEALHREGEAFLATVIRVLIQFGNKCRYSLAPKTHIYRSLTQILVGRVLLRALHVNRLKFFPKNRAVPPKPKSPGDSESGRVNLYSDEESVSPDKDMDPSAIASSDGLLFIIPVETLVSSLFSKSNDISDSPFTDYLCLLQGLLWTKEVDDIALGLTLTSILLKAVPLNDCAITVHRFGIADLTALHEHESAKRLEALALGKAALSMDSRRFSSHHVTARGLEVKKLVSAGVVLCPKCHPAELHLTRHSSFRCDLCGNGVDRGFPMHGCRECDWDACEDCIDLREGGIVKWKHVELVANECTRLLAEVDKCDPGDTVKAEISAKDWSLQMMAARIKALDEDVLSGLSVQLSSPGALTMFEFCNYVLPVLHEALCGRLMNERSSLISAAYDPPRKKQRPQFRQTSNGVVDRLDFMKKVANTLIVQPVSLSLNSEKADRESERKHASPMGINMDEDSATVVTTIRENRKHSTRHAPELLRRLHDVLSFFENFPSSRSILAGTVATSDDLHSLTKPWTIEVFQFEQPFVVRCEPLMQLSCLQNHLLRSTACSNPPFVAYCQRYVIQY